MDADCLVREAIHVTAPAPNVQKKFSQGEYELTEKYDLDLRNKIGTFQTKTETRMESKTKLIMIASVNRYINP